MAWLCLFPAGNEPAAASRLACIGLIVCGIVGLKFTT
jgi:multidrug transporter EmrE-like cation transporter